MAAILKERLERPDPTAWEAVLTGKARPATNGWPVSRLVLDHHPRLAERVAGWIERRARDRFELGDARLRHRVGAIPAGDVIVVALARGDPRESLQATRWMLEATKRHLPIWKREEGPEGSRWVEGEHLTLPTEANHA